MQIYNKQSPFRISEQLDNILKQIGKKGVNLSQFKRDALIEKIKKEHPELVKEELIVKPL